MPGDERLVLEDFLHEGAHLSAAFDPGILGKDAAARGRELFEGVSHRATSCFRDGQSYRRGAAGTSSAAAGARRGPVRRRSAPAAAGTWLASRCRRPPGRRRRAQRIGRAVLAAALTVAGIWVLHAFLAALVWAGIFAIALWPLYRRLVAATAGRGAR